MLVFTILSATKHVAVATKGIKKVKVKIQK
jgi:hypothetical protein